MKSRNIRIIVMLTIVAILILATLFFLAVKYTNSSPKKVIVGSDIALPDRIVYRNEDGNYYEFKKGEESYENIKNLLKTLIRTYDQNGEIVSQEDVDEIHTTTFIELDYETISKNYIIQLEKNKDREVIRLANTGGRVVTKKINNINKLKNTVEKLSKEEKAYKLEYKEEISRNKLDYLEYKYTQLFKNLDNVYQAKVDNFDEYKILKLVCNIAIENEITEETFKDNEVIVTVTLRPKIDVKVNIGNIRYTYDDMKDVNYGYNVHVLIVSKIVNTDCIYNTDLVAIENEVYRNDFEVDYNESVDNLDTNIFVTDFETFQKERDLASSKISEEKAIEIANNGFLEAERICTKTDERTQTVTKEKVLANNFFTRKIDEGDKTYGNLIEVYAVTRTDEMELTGVTIYVDTITGKIVGGSAFGD